MPATHNAFHDPINAGTKTNDHVVGPLFINLLKNLLAGRDAQGIAVAPASGDAGNSMWGA